MSILLLVKIATLTPLIEESCDKKWAIFSVECMV